MSLVDDLLRELEEVEGSTSAAKKAKVSVIALAGGHIEDVKTHAYREAMIQSWEQQYCYTCPLLISQSGADADAIQASWGENHLLSVKFRAGCLTTAEHIRLLVEEAQELYGEDDPMVILSELDGIWGYNRLYEVYSALKKHNEKISLLKFFLCASPSDTEPESSDAISQSEVYQLFAKKTVKLSYFTDPKSYFDEAVIKEQCKDFIFNIPFYFQICLRLSQLKKFFDESAEETLKFFEVYLPLWVTNNINKWCNIASITESTENHNSILEFSGWSYFHRHRSSVEHMWKYFGVRINTLLIPPLDKVAGSYIYLVFRQKMLCYELNYEVVEDVLREKNTPDHLIKIVRPFVEKVLQKCGIAEEQ